METTQHTIHSSAVERPELERKDPVRTTHRLLAGSYSIESVAGAGVVTLAILALANVLPVWLTGIAVIVAGGAFLVEGAGLGARARQIRRSLHAQDAHMAAFTGGVSVQLLAGVTGVTLGILALVGIATDPLLAIAAIVFGGALLLGTSATHELSRFEGQRSRLASAVRETIHASNGAHVMVGAAVIALGILDLIGVGPNLVLVTIALLSVGALFFVTGAAIGAAEASEAAEPG